MPTGSVRLQSIKKLGHENQSYEFSDEGNSPLGSMSRDVGFHHMHPEMIESLILHLPLSHLQFELKIVLDLVLRSSSFLFSFPLLQNQAAPTCKFLLLHTKSNV